MIGQSHMKKILLLGGSRYLLPVIEKAHQLGCYVVTCDYLPDNIAHRYSDEYSNISIIDKAAVLAMAAEKKIDGVMSFACDPGVVTAAYVAEKLGLPSCGSYESVCILQNKGKFRKFLLEHEFNVPRAEKYSTYNEAKKKINKFRWPVIVKPTDSAGSKGVTRIDDPKGLENAISRALAFSHDGEVIVEEFIEKKGFSSDSDCFSVDGELKFVSFSDQRFDRNASNPYTPAAFSWPPTMQVQYQSELKEELQRLLILLNMGTSIYNVETRIGTDGQAYIMEVSPRGGGNRLAEMMRYAADVDLIESAVKAALGESVNVEQKEYNGNWAEVILHGDKKGKFDSLWISDKIKNNIVEKDLWIKKGDTVKPFTGANETIGTLILKFGSQMEMSQKMEQMQNLVQVIVEDEKIRGGAVET